jgi:hypothetical protein
MSIFMLHTVQTVTKWFAPSPLDVASYDIELKMEIQLWKLCNISRRLCEEVTAPKGAVAHTLGTTALGWKTQVLYRYTK